MTFKALLVALQRNFVVKEPMQPNNNSIQEDTLGIHP